MKEETNIEIAKRLMKIIMYDNGMVNRFNPEVYPEEHVKEIASAAGLFFEAHPEFFTDQDLENICAGELEENAAKYGIYPEYKALDYALNEFFDPS